MTGFYPPYPAGKQKKMNPVSRFLVARYNMLSSFYAKSYKMKLGDFRALHRHFYFPVEHTLVDQILQDPVRYPKSDLMGPLLDQLLGQSIFITNGDVWESQRKMMAPALENARIRETFAKMVEAADCMIGRMKPHANGGHFFIDHEMAHVTADIIFRTIYSREMTKANSSIIFDAFASYQELAYSHGVSTMAGVPQFLSLPRLRARKHARAVRALLESCVDERLEEIRIGKTEKRDILQSLIEAIHPQTGKRFTKSELIDQVAILFLAGHETSASALSWALYLISNVPETAARIQNEADEFWKDGAEFRKLSKLKYTRDVFRETMRLYPPVAIFPRDASQAENMRGKKIARKSILFIAPWLNHRQTNIWRDADMFNPDRFSDGTQDEAIRNHYIPFSKGPRVCLGASFALQEAVIILSAILHNFDVTVAKGHIPEPVARLTVRPINGIAIRLSPR